MALIDIWKASSEELSTKYLDQILVLAGHGKLGDGNDTSHEFREFLSHVPPELIDKYANECLVRKFEDSGFALQDIVNEIGQRLQFKVTPGRYRGSRNRPGHDGLWRTDDGHQIVVEVKTTDAYRISIDTVANYREGLIQSGEIVAEGSSILIVVGRQDTGDLEAQIRGSRHAWDVRVIGVDGLLKLMHVVTEEIESPAIARQVLSILIPQEFTRVDGIVDLVFDTTDEVTRESNLIEDAGQTSLPNIDRESAVVRARFNKEVAERVAHHLDTNLNPKTRSIYMTPDGQTVVVALASREYPSVDGVGYWYGFHDYQRDALSSVGQAYVALGCGSEEDILLVPWTDFQDWLVGMNTTERPGHLYWHVHPSRSPKGYSLRLKEGFGNVEMTRYWLKKPSRS